MRALILDDDPHARALLALALERRFPGLEIEERGEPDLSGDFDVYFLDNDFGGAGCAAELARQVRDRAPRALVVAFSGTLDRGLLKALINAGCDGACEKGQHQDLRTLLELTGNYLSAVERLRAREVGSARFRRSISGAHRGVLGALRSIRGLLREWNERLDQSEQDVAASSADEVAA